MKSIYFIMFDAVFNCGFVVVQIDFLSRGKDEIDRDGERAVEVNTEM